MIFLSYSYTKKDIDITNYEFTRYIKPQLKSITLDYKTLLIGLTPEIKNISNAFKFEYNILDTLNALPSNCINQVGERCKLKLHTLKKNIISMQKELKKLKVADIKLLSIDNRIKAQSLLKKLDLKFIQIIDQVEVRTLKLGFSRSQSVNLLKLKLSSSQFLSLFNTFTLTLIDKRYRDDLHRYYTSFILPVTKHILIQNRVEILIQNINDFNIRLNALVMKLTKFNHPVSKKVKTLSNIIHNRWNSILKVSLITK